MRKRLTKAQRIRRMLAQQKRIKALKNRNTIPMGNQHYRRVSRASLDRYAASLTESRMRQSKAEADSKEARNESKNLSRPRPDAKAQPTTAGMADARESRGLAMSGMSIASGLTSGSNSPA